MKTDSLHILIATDGSDEAGAAVAVLQNLPLPAGTVIRVVSVREAAAAVGPPPYTGAMTELLEFEAEDSKAAVEAAAAALRRGDYAVTSSIRKGAAAREILEEAREAGSDMIVLGAKVRSGLPGLLLGSAIREVTHHSPVPVLVARPPRRPFGTLVLATDGCPPALQATRFVARLSLPESVEVILTRVLHPYEAEPSLLEYGSDAFNATIAELRREEEAAATRLLSEQAQERPPGRRVRTKLRVGEPASEILKLAGEVDADLIVAGTRKVSFAENLLIGSVAHRLVKEAPCSVLLVP